MLPHARYIFVLKWCLWRSLQLQHYLFSNWAKEHPDEAVGRNVFAVQDHTEAVDKTNYNINSKVLASRVTRQVMEDSVMAEVDVDEDGIDEDSAVDG